MDEKKQERERYRPQVLVDTENLPREEWLRWRRHGIGGSDVAAILGISPFRTARDIYFDKLGIAAVEADDGNWVPLEIGHLLEGLIARIFEHKSGFQVRQVKKMFCHPRYPFMLADVDAFVIQQDGSTAILEIKTTNYNAKDRWWQNGKEIVPAYYEAQGRHYMAVCDIDRVFFCCLYGNTEDEIIIRELRRDFDYEDEMIFLEKEFWESVQAKVLPPYTESGELILDSVKRYGSPADPAAQALVLDRDMETILLKYMELQKEKKKAEEQSQKLEKDVQRLKAILIAGMGAACTAVCDQGEKRYTITYHPVRRTGIEKNNLERLKLQYPEIYEKFVTVSEFRVFRVKAGGSKNLKPPEKGKEKK